MNVRQKGKRSENYFANLLRSVFPNVHRNWKEQSAIGGIDLSETNPFDFEIKSGKQVKLKKIRQIINQVQSEGNKNNWKVVLVKPDREQEYAIIPIDDFIEILEAMKKEGII